MNEGTPIVQGSMKIWKQVGRATGAKAISLRLLEFGPGTSPLIQNHESDEVLYFLEEIQGVQTTNENCSVELDGQSFDVRSQTGIYLRPGQTMVVKNHGPARVVFVSAQCPEPVSRNRPASGDVSPERVTLTKPIVFPGVRLSDRPAIPTADRWYRVLVDDEIGSQQVTQFVGSIPPGRAPDHFHQYEEVLFILRGQGRMWAGESHTNIAPGACIYLPRGQVHCVENTDTDELRLLGVFYPAGSPSVRYEA
jgi:mannose-6-phosphate isomerase-like protein (cupin superfamily)